MFYPQLKAFNSSFLFAQYILTIAFPIQQKYVRIIYYISSVVTHTITLCATVKEKKHCQ